MDGSDADAGTLGDGGGRNGTGPPDGTPIDADEAIAPATVADALAATSSARDAALVVPDPARRPERLSSVLVAVGDGPHSGATVDLARRLASDGGAVVELFHVVPPAEGPPNDPDEGGGPRARGEALLDAASDRLEGFECVDRWLMEGESAADAIVEQSAYYDAVVVGTSTAGTVGSLVFGSTTGDVRERAECPVVVVTADGETRLVDDR